MRRTGADHSRRYPQSSRGLHPTDGQTRRHVGYHQLVEVPCLGDGAGTRHPGRGVPLPAARRPPVHVRRRRCPRAQSSGERAVSFGTADPCMSRKYAPTSLVVRPLDPPQSLPWDPVFLSWSILPAKQVLGVSNRDQINRYSNSPPQSNTLNDLHHSTGLDLGPCGTRFLNGDHVGERMRCGWTCSILRMCLLLNHFQ